MRDAWLGAGATLLAVAVLTASILYLDQKSKGLTRDEKEHFSSVGALLFVGMAHIGRRFPKEPKSTSSRVAFASVSIGGFILISVYRLL